jgi:hypothetical protein
MAGRATPAQTGLGIPRRPWLGIKPHLVREMRRLPLVLDKV